MKKLKPPLG